MEFSLEPCKVREGKGAGGIKEDPLRNLQGAPLISPQGRLSLLTGGALAQGKIAVQETQDMIG